jgi:hypothetical protein
VIEISIIVLVEAMPDQCDHTYRSVELNNKNQDYYHYEKENHKQKHSIFHQMKNTTKKKKQQKLIILLQNYENGVPDFDD